MQGDRNDIIESGKQDRCGDPFCGNLSQENACLRMVFVFETVDKSLYDAFFSEIENGCAKHCTCSGGKIGLNRIVRIGFVAGKRKMGQASAAEDTFGFQQFAAAMGTVAGIKERKEIPYCRRYPR